MFCNFFSINTSISKRFRVDKINRTNDELFIEAECMYGQYQERLSLLLLRRSGSEQAQFLQKQEGEDSGLPMRKAQKLLRSTGE